MKTTRVTNESLAGSLATIKSVPLASIPPAQAARVKRRILDNESLASRLDIAAFNSAV